MEINLTTERIIEQCLDLTNPKSFFLFAGAGSGKTRSLVNALKFIKSRYGYELFLHSKKIGIITYTNPACDEIKERLDYDPLFDISTIHSFIWSQIKHHQADIKQWVAVNLRAEIQELQTLQAKGRAGTKAAIDREKSILSKTIRIQKLDEVIKFTYNPNGENLEFDSLNHSEVIKIGADFLSKKPMMQKLLISKYPILFIDESQDTNKLLMEALFSVEVLHKKKFMLGLFGDTMQRIYVDGKIDLGTNLPSHWVKPQLSINYRCPSRIITLINKIRSNVDEHRQKPGNDKIGIVRLFVLPIDYSEKDKIEAQICKLMASYTGDDDWESRQKVKILTLEHHMAARRLRFSEMFEILYKVDRFKTGLLDGTLSSIRVFTQFIYPIIKANKLDDKLTITSIVRKYSPILSTEAIRFAKGGQLAQIHKARDAVKNLLDIYHEKESPTFFDMINSVYKTGLFPIPQNLLIILNRTRDEDSIAENEIMSDESEDEDDGEEVIEGTEHIDALDRFLRTPFNQIEDYILYINGQSSFDTHQGIKGREFSKVMVIMNDSEARGFLFSYEKLLGAKAKSASDKENEKEGADTSIDRTRRLLYVTCSRAQDSLALVSYTQDPAAVIKETINQGWFSKDEVKDLDSIV